MIHILLEMRIVFAKRCCWGAPREALKHSTSSSTVMEPRKPAYRVFSGGDPCLPLQLAVWPGEGPDSLDLLGPSVKGRSHWLAGNQMDKLTAVGSCERGSHVVHCSVAQSCPTLCDSMDCSIPDIPVLQDLLKFAQSPVH